MYPATIFNWYDQSAISVPEDEVELTPRPLFMVVGSFDKGPEDFQRVYGSTFNDIYGTMSFTRHGQNSIQAQRIIDAGGELFIKRVCAEDATIANTIYVATVTTETKQAVNSEGKSLYLDENGKETTDVTANPLNKTTASIKWEAKSIENCKSKEEVKKAALKLLDVEGGVFPVMMICDIGRGDSSKAIRIVPNYNTSRNIGKMFYSLMIYEGTYEIETQPMTLDPTVIYDKIAYGLDDSTSVQVSGETIDDVYEAFVDKIATAIGMSVNQVKNQDLIYGFSNRGAVIDGISVDAESIDMNANYGIELKNGSNGSFGSAPVNSAGWVEAIRKVFAGEITDKVYDVDQYKLYAIVDANFPKIIKDAIANLVNFRKDCVFFRDFGVDLETFTDISDKYSENKIRSRFIANYGTWYEVKDPSTKKNIKVTMMYDFVEPLCTHFANSPFTPLAGTANGFILKEAIKDTVNFIPIITPSANQKEAIDDIKVNYAIFQGDDCVVQTEYTCQEEYTQLSFVNNVIGIQTVARAVRTECPKNRYKLITGKDLSDYTKAVNRVLANFNAYFETLELVYTADPLKIAQKIYYAGINFRFLDFIQTEIFDLFALSNE